MSYPYDNMDNMDVCKSMYQRCILEQTERYLAKGDYKNLLKLVRSSGSRFMSGPDEVDLLRLILGHQINEMSNYLSSLKKSLGLLRRDLGEEGDKLKPVIDDIRKMSRALEERLWIKLYFFRKHFNTFIFQLNIFL